MKIEIHRNGTSEPTVHDDAINAYAKGEMYCVLVETLNRGRVVYKYPMASIFRVAEIEGQNEAAPYAPSEKVSDRLERLTENLRQSANNLRQPIKRTAPTTPKRQAATKTKAKRKPTKVVASVSRGRPKKAIRADGQMFESAKEAAVNLGVHESVIRSRVKSVNWPTYSYAK